METAIKVENLSKIYNLYDKPSDRLKEALSITRKQYHKEYYALKDISFEIKKGDSVGIIGKNGSGKSTILKILTGVLQPSKGNIKTNGRISALLELGAGFNNEYTGMENIFLNGMMMGFNRSQMEAKVDEIINFADIGEFINQPVKTYSSGMFVRLAFAVAINVEPDILIVDEALAVGDVRFQLKCMDKFTEFKEKGITIIFVSHDTNAIKRFCERAIWLNEGSLMLDGDVDTVADKYLDYLKELDFKNSINEIKKIEEIQLEEQNKEEEKNELVDIAEIRKVSIIDQSNKETDTINFGEKIRVKVEYYVNDLSISNPVLGVAILRIDNLYICGLNTLLDNVKIPWKKGKNIFILEYESFNLIGGSYYLDVALFDKTATVQIDYRTRIKEFFVKMEYVAEGITVLKHKWEN